MKFLTLRSAPTLALAVLLAGCSNPADETPDALVSDVGPTEVSLSPADPSLPALAPGEAIAFGPETSTIGFVGSKVGPLGRHDGGFKEFEGELSLATDAPELRSISVVIDMESTWSDNEKLTGHLKNADFFDVPKYPTTTFTSTEIAPIEGGSGEGESEWTHNVKGTLTLHGVTKSITFPARVEVTDESVLLTSMFDLKRGEFAIVYGNGLGENAIRDEVVIKLDVKAPRGTADVQAGG